MSYKKGGLRPFWVPARLFSCQIARKSQDFSHRIPLLFFIYFSWSKKRIHKYGNDSYQLGGVAIEAKTKRFERSNPFCSLPHIYNPMQLSGWHFSGYRMIIFQFWYQVSAVVWVILATTMIVLITKLLKLTKRSNRFYH